MPACGSGSAFVIPPASTEPPISLFGKKAASYLAPRSIYRAAHPVRLWERVASCPKLRHCAIIRVERLQTYPEVHKPTNRNSAVRRDCRPCYRCSAASAAAQGERPSPCFFLFFSFLFFSSSYVSTFSYDVLLAVFRVCGMANHASRFGVGDTACASCLTRVVRTSLAHVCRGWSRGLWFVPLQFPEEE